MGSSAKQEHRWRKNLFAANSDVSDRKRELEAAFMERGIRKPCLKPEPAAARRQVRAWMRRNVSGFDSATHLTEAANAALKLPPGAMDGAHWIWDEAMLALESCGRVA